jgi:hypothetical protein
MSHFGFLPGQNQGVSSMQQSQTPRTLPVLDWPADLFECNTVGSECHEALDPFRFAPGTTEHRQAFSH